MLSPTPARSASTAHAPATRIALLDAAERLFSEQGVEATSVRAIVKAAAANLGAITYHFGSKDRLALEVFARRLEPVNKVRLAKLTALEKSAKGRALKIEHILEAFIRPVVEDETSGERHTDEFIKLISRCFQEQQEEIKAFMFRQFGEVVRRFDEALLRALPGLEPEELFWRMNFLIGGLHHALERWSRFGSSTIPPWLNPKKVRRTREDFIQSFIVFAAAGLRASTVRRS